MFEVSSALDRVAAKEKVQRDAASHSSKCRDVEEKAREQLQHLKQLLVEFDRQHDVLRERTIHAAASLRTAEERRDTCIHLLGSLWAALPAAVSEFEADASGFRASFENATGERRQLELRLAELQSKIQEATAAIGPLQDSQRIAQGSLGRLEFELQNIENNREQQLNRRRQLYQGKSADEIEAEIQGRLQTASKILEESKQRRNEADKNLAMANSEVESSHRAYSLAESRLALARAGIASWLDGCTSRTSRILSESELDLLLDRNDAWLKAEQAALDQLEHDVKSSEGAFSVHSKQLQEHLNLRLGPEEESTVLEALEAQRAELSAAKEDSNSVRAVVLNDDERRKNNLSLTSVAQSIRYRGENHSGLAGARAGAGHFGIESAADRVVVHRRRIRKPRPGNAQYGDECIDASGSSGTQSRSDFSRD